MRKTRLIAWREYLASVKTKTFLIGILLTPAIMGVAFLVPLLFPSEDRHFKVLDGTGGQLWLILEQAYKEEERAKRRTNKDAIKRSELFKLEPDKDSIVNAATPGGRGRMDRAVKRLKDELENADSSDPNALFAFFVIEPSFLSDDQAARDGRAVRYFSRNKAYRDLRANMEKNLRVLRGQLRAARFINREMPRYSQDVLNLAVKSALADVPAHQAETPRAGKDARLFHVLDETGLVLPNMLATFAGIRGNGGDDGGTGNGEEQTLLERASRATKQLRGKRWGAWKISEWKAPRIEGAESILDWQLWMQGIDPAAVPLEQRRLLDGGSRVVVPAREALKRFRERLREGELDAFLHVTPAFLSSAEPPADALVWEHAPGAPSFDDLDPDLAYDLRQVAWQTRFAQEMRATNAPVRATSIDPATEKEVRGVDIGAEIIVPFVFVFLLFFGVFGISQALLTNVVEEKSGRIVEVLLSSVSPTQIMTGKIVGIGAVGFTLLLIWSGAGYTTAYYNVPREILDAYVTPRILGFFLMYYMLGFAFLASILAAIGAACNTIKEAQNLAGVFNLVMIVPMVTVMPIAQDPAGTPAMVMSFVPFFTPFVMMNRLTTNTPPETWEIIASVLLMLVSVAAAFWVAGRVFRVGILMYGNPPKLRDLLSWIRAGD